MNGEVNDAVAAGEHVSSLKHMPPEIVRAASLFSDGDLSVAENILRAYLRHASNSVEALRLVARIEHQRGALDDAELRLEAALKLSPSYRAARLDYVRVLIDRQKYLHAHEMIHTLLQLEPGNRDYLLLYAAACAGLGRHTSAVVVYHQLLARSPRSSDLHVLLGHSLKAVGRQREAIDSYQAAAAVKPGFGDDWSLANLKTYGFSQDEIACMRAWEDRARHRPGRSLPSVLRSRQGVRGPEGVRGILAILRERQPAQARRKPLPSLHRGNQYEPAD